MKYRLLLFLLFFQTQTIKAQDNSNFDKTFFWDELAVNHIIDEYQFLGLFDHLTDEEIAIGRQIAVEMPISSHQDILMCFPKTVAFFNWETSNLKNPYQELIQEFATITRGGFNPEKISDCFSENRYQATTQLSFECNEKHYSKTFNMMGKFLSPKVLILMEQVLNDLQVNGRWHVCFSNSSSVAYVFLTDDQYRYLKAYQPGLFDIYKSNS